LAARVLREYSVAMDGAWLARLRWRRRGAWMWPAFAALTIADAVVGHELPPAGDGQSVAAAALLGCALNLIGVVVLSWPVSLLIRRARSDLPAVVARDYGGTLVLVAVTGALLAIGLAHRSSVLADREALRQATVRAEAWIGDRAPAEFRRETGSISVFTIETGRIYRACVRSMSGTRTYCVVVNDQVPFPRGVRFAGSEPNSGLATGMD
jgi:hypothetical protein